MRKKGGRLPIVLFCVALSAFFATYSPALNAAKTQRPHGLAIQEEFKKDVVVQYFLNRDYMGAFNFAKHWAELGFPDAQAMLGVMYAGRKFFSHSTLEQFLEKLLDVKIEDGVFDDVIRNEAWSKVPNDETKAFYWVEKAAKSDTIFTRFALASFYITGIGVKKDYGKAVEILRNNAERADVRSLRLLGYILATIERSSTNQVEAYKWMYLGFYCYGTKKESWDFMKESYLDEMPKDVQKQGKQEALEFVRHRIRPCSAPE